jgi:ABC-type antimicrobial peptide transport system permease subunit
MKTSSLHQEDLKSLDWRVTLRNKYVWISLGAILLIVVGGYFAYDYFSAQAVETSEVPQIQTAVARSGDLTVFATGAGQVIPATEVNLGFDEAATAAFRNLLTWVAAVSLLVGGIGIMNIMLVSVTERTREIGIRQSVGASPSDIRFQFLTEALLLSLVGGLIGVMAGIGGAYLFGELGEMRTVVVPGSVLLAFSSAAAVGIFFGFYPANKASQLDPIDALRHE